MTGPEFSDATVARAFADLPAQVRPALLAVRALVFEVAAETEGVGAIEETLKWGQPAYLTRKTGAGSTLRLGAAAVFVHCQTTILSDVARAFPEAFAYEDNRAARFDPAAPPKVPLRALIRTALTYHLAKRRGAGAPARSQSINVISPTKV
ncbi:MAG: DUF1801 domain-containing protein [Paracoccaceae bacterium]|nr:DUF1801 domain-containing protein [Paracoccaceae bacterium]